MSRNLAVCYGSGVDHGTIVILPSDGVLVDSAAECRGVFCVCGSSDNLGSPAGEGVGILIGRVLSRIGVSRNLAVCDGGGVDHGTIVILPCDGVLGDVHSKDHMLVPVVAAVSVRTEVNIISAIGSDRVVVACAGGVPCPILTGFILDDLDRVGIGKGNIVQHELVALCLGIRCQQISVIDLPLGHGADNIVACLVLRGALECRDIGRIAVYDRQLIGCVEVRAARPTDEVIGKVVVFVLSRSIAVIGRKCAGLYILVGLEDFVAVHPCYGVGGSGLCDGVPSTSCNVSCCSFGNLHIAERQTCYIFTCICRSTVKLIALSLVGVPINLNRFYCIVFDICFGNIQPGRFVECLKSCQCRIFADAVAGLTDDSQGGSNNRQGNLVIISQIAAACRADRLDSVAVIAVDEVVDVRRNHNINAALEPVVAAVAVRTEVDIIGAVGSDLIVVVHAVGIPCPIARFILHDLDRVGIGKGNIVQHELVALCLGIRCQQISVIDLPLGHGADNIVACLVLRGAAECRDIGRIAVNYRQLIGIIEIRAAHPADEFIGKVVVFVLSRGLAVIGRSISLSNAICFDGCAVPVIPCYGLCSVELNIAIVCRCAQPNCVSCMRMMCCAVVELCHYSVEIYPIGFSVTVYDACVDCVIGMNIGYIIFHGIGSNLNICGIAGISSSIKPNIRFFRQVCIMHRDSFAVCKINIGRAGTAGDLSVTADRDFAAAVGTEENAVLCGIRGDCSACHGKGAGAPHAQVNYAVIA